MRIVADTNIVLSGLLWRGTPHRLLTEIGHSSSIVLVSSAPLLEELAAVLIRPKYSGRLGLIGQSAGQVLTAYLQAVELVEPAVIPPTSRDPDDDAVLACAVAAHADFIVSGDADLLVLGAFSGIPIVTAPQALEGIAARSRT